MHWPQPQEYFEAVQNPQSAFRDSELASGRPRTNALGLPMPFSGNLADVYCWELVDGRKLAVKLFTRPIHGFADRYRAIAAHLIANPIRAMVDFDFVDKGIAIGNAAFPVLKMSWVEGEPLNSFVAKACRSSQQMRALASIWYRVAKEMRENGIAHGDLQHGNVLMVPGRGANTLALRLVDYDGSCVPDLERLPSQEVGHPCYQHRLRKSDSASYGPHMDRFSMLLVYTALRCLEYGGESLWKSSDNGDNLLFQSDDIDFPTQSRLLQRLFALPDDNVRRVVAHLVEASSLPLQKIRHLCDLVDDNGIVTKAPHVSFSTASPKMAPTPRPKTTPSEPPALRSRVSASLTQTVRPATMRRRMQRRRNTYRLPILLAVGLSIVATAFASRSFILRRIDPPIPTIRYSLGPEPRQESVDIPAQSTASNPAPSAPEKQAKETSLALNEFPTPPQEHSEPPQSTEKPRVTIEPISWKASLEDAMRASQRSNRPILINFYATWCNPCKQLDDITFTNAELCSFVNEQFVAVGVDIDKHKKHVARYKVKGIPATVVLLPSGKVAGSFAGFRDSGQYVNELKRILAH